MSQSLDEHELKTIRFIKPELLKEESELFHTKHWDYRFEHPAVSTERFVEAYRQAYRRALVRRTDIDLANDKVTARQHLFQMTVLQINALWKARQTADRIGCSYDFYCEEVMRFADRVHMAKLPRVTALCETDVPHWCETENGNSMVSHVIGRWLDYERNAVNYATHPAYLAENYTGLSNQNDYLNYIAERIMRSTCAVGVFASAANKGQIDMAMLRRIFKSDAFIDSLIRRSAKLLDHPLR